ncbi:MAG: hypothetical protein LBB29_03260 [Holosporaceae bacterium]|jgi:hypothetical protein|nr:hypothetical protein [Holosporaceae bacterium]
MKLLSIIFAGIVLIFVDINALETGSREVEETKEPKIVSQINLVPEGDFGEDATPGVIHYSTVRNFVLGINNVSTFMLGMISAASNIHAQSSKGIDAKNLFMQKLQSLTPEQLVEKGKRGIEVIEEAFQLSQLERPDLLSDLKLVRDELENAGIRVSTDNQVVEVDIDEIIHSCCGFLFSLTNRRK